MAAGKDPSGSIGKQKRQLVNRFKLKFKLVRAAHKTKKDHTHQTARKGVHCRWHDVLQAHALRVDQIRHVVRSGRRTVQWVRVGWTEWRCARFGARRCGQRFRQRAGRRVARTGRRGRLVVEYGRVWFSAFVLRIFRWFGEGGWSGWVGWKRAVWRIARTWLLLDAFIAQIVGRWVAVAFQTVIAVLARWTALAVHRRRIGVVRDVHYKLLVGFLAVTVLFLVNKTILNLQAFGLEEEEEECKRAREREREWKRRIDDVLIVVLRIIRKEQSSKPRKKTNLFIFFALLHIVYVVVGRSGSKLIIGRIALIIIYAFCIAVISVCFLFNLFNLFVWTNGCGLVTRTSGQAGRETRDDYNDMAFYDMIWFLRYDLVWVIGKRKRWKWGKQVLKIFDSTSIGWFNFLVLDVAGKADWRKKWTFGHNLYAPRKATLEIGAKLPASVLICCCCCCCGNVQTSRSGGLSAIKSEWVWVFRPRERRLIW